MPIQVQTIARELDNAKLRAVGELSQDGVRAHGIPCRQPHRLPAIPHRAGACP